MISKIKIAAYYFGTLSIIAGLLGIICLYEGRANMFFGTMPVAAISAFLFVVLMRMYDKMKIKALQEAEGIKRIDEQTSMRIAEYGGEHVLIDGNFYTVLRRTFTIILLAGTLFSCDKQKEDTVLYEPQEVLMPSYACPDTLIVMDAPKLSAAMQLVYDGTIDATDYSIDSILHQYCIDAYDYTNKFGSLPKSK